MKILGIESSCDDTSVALMDCSKRGCFAVKELTASQIEVHKKYGGVVPEIAGRLHAEKIVPLIEEVLSGSKPDSIAVTSGPGLITGLIVGVEAARTLSYTWGTPLVGVNHIEGHIHAVEISTTNKIKYPALALVVSGGHTELIYIKKENKYKKIGATVDDAAGECFDKVAKLLDLSYPGGPEISKMAITGKTDVIKFPRPMLEQKNFNFSFSGLKTSALYWLQKNTVIARNVATKQSDGHGISSSSRLSVTPRNDKITTADFCASLEQAIVDVLIGKTIRAAKKYQPKTIILAGGVAANKKLRTDLAEKIKAEFPNTKFVLPDTKYCMDNAAMIAVAGYNQLLDKNLTSWKKIQADPNWELA